MNAVTTFNRRQTACILVTQLPLIACSMRYARMWQVTTALHAQARICANRSSEVIVVHSPSSHLGTVPLLVSL